MSASAWVLFLVMAAAATGFALFVYRRREADVKHRRLLTTLRALALVLLLLLIFDPTLPASGRDRVRTVVALDRSLSMRLPLAATDTTSRWSEALTRARSLADDAPVLVFGADVTSVPADSLTTVTPDAHASRLLPAVRAAAEAGARRLVVVSDGGVEDGAEVVRWLARYGIALDLEQVGDGRPASRALAELEAPAWMEAGEPVPVRVAVGPGDAPATLTLTAPGAEPVRAEVPAGGAGRLQVADLEITPATPEGGGMVRLDVALDGAPDGTRSVYVYVGEEPAGVALVSLRPDQEPRFLVPVLETALGLPVRAFLRAADGAFVRVGAAEDAGQRVTAAEVQRAVAEAELLVLHGAGGDAPEWARTAAENATRLIVFPADAGAPGVPVSLGQPVTDDFYITSDVPSSPIAPLLSGLELDGLSPLTELRTATAIDPGEAGGAAGSASWAPLLASRLRRAAPQPAVMAGESAGRRWAVALGAGYWRWAFRDQAGRTVYARLWGALAGWLLREEGAVASDAVRPATHSVARGTLIPWIAPGLPLDSLQIALTAVGTDSAQTSMVRAAGTDTLRSAAPAPGHYAYTATAFIGDSVAARADGPLTVERYSPESTRPAIDLAALQAQATPVSSEARDRGPMRPLRAGPAPWLLLVALLAAEWILRRRWGLR